MGLLVPFSTQPQVGRLPLPHGLCGESHRSHPPRIPGVGAGWTVVGAAPLAYGWRGPSDYSCPIALFPGAGAACAGLYEQSYSRGTSHTSKLPSLLVYCPPSAAAQSARAHCHRRPCGGGRRCAGGMGGRPGRHDPQRAGGRQGGGYVPVAQRTGGVGALGRWAPGAACGWTVGRQR